MTVTNRTTPAQGQRGTRALAWAVLAASILQVVAPIITSNGPGRSPGDGSGPELLITPVGWAFSIWGVIYALAIGQAIAVLVRGADSVSRRQQIGLLVLYLGGALWIVLAGLDSSEATAAALVLMFVAATIAVLTVARERIEPGWLAELTRAAVGLYAGWVTAAVFLNISTALVDTDVVEADVVSWQLVVLVVAAVVLLAVVVATGGIITYAAAGVWAMIGIAVTGNSDGTTEVTITAIACAAVLTVTTIIVRLAGRRGPTVV